MIKHRFSWANLVTVSLLIGFIGFGLGFNWQQLENNIRTRLIKPVAQVPSDLDYSSLETAYDALRQNYAGNLDINKLLEGAKAGLVKAAGDPYTVYLGAQDAQQFKEALSGTFSGIGAEVAIKQNKLVIIAPVNGSPAAKAGLRAGDEIPQINGASTADMSVDTAVGKIRGKAGTTVKLTIVRAGGRPHIIALKRAVINVPSVESKLKPHHIGYISLSRFDDNSADQLHAAALKLKQQGANKFVLDLRNNPGGLLNVAVAIADDFLDNTDVIVQEKRGDTVIETDRAHPGGALVGLPVAVLVNKGSASASEIIAGALQDDKAAKIVGEQTFGKGSVQELIKLGNQSVLKVTVALWYTPNGRNINKAGIAPDIKIGLSNKDFESNRDPQLRAALRLLEHM